MAALLPLACLLLAVLGCEPWARGLAFHRIAASGSPARPHGSWRSAMLMGCVLTGTFAVAATEVLSAWAALHRAALLALWTAALAGLVWLNLRHRRTRDRPAAGARAGLGADAWLIIAVIASILLVIASIAFLAAPNNFDSMTYHLSRIAHWQQNQSVHGYPTSIPRQLSLAPGAEYLIAQLFVLGGSDRSVALVQWWALLGCVIGVSLIAGQLGASRRGQLLAAVTCVTLPMAVLQGSSTQNDLVASLWLVCSVYFGRLVIAEAKPLTTVLLGLSLGLVVVTKASAALLLAPFFLVSGVALRRQRGATAWRTLALLVVTVPWLTAPHLARSHALWGNPLGPLQEADQSYAYLTDSWTPAAAISGVSRNLALHAGTSWGSLDSRAEDAVRGLHRALDLDADDPRTTWGGLSFGVGNDLRDEDAAGNPLHLLLLVAGLAGFAKRPLRDPSSLLFALCLVAAFVLLSSTIRWTPWNARLHLPLFVLAAPLTGAALSRWLRPVGTFFLCLLLAASARTPLLENVRRPLLGPGSILQAPRSQQYFAALPGARIAYLDALRIVEQDLGCAQVGLALGTDDFEFPLWALSSPTGGVRTRFEHVAVLNPSARFPPPTVPPCAVLISHSRPEQRLAVRGRTYGLDRDLGHLRILLPPAEAQTP